MNEDVVDGLENKPKREIAMDKELKDVNKFPENATNKKSPSWKNYVKLVLPHIILVVAVCLYAVIGAWVFYSLESPHEDMLKKIGIEKISELRIKLIQELAIKRKELKNIEMDKWARVTDEKLQIFNEYLYKAFKEHYVRYADIRIFKTNFDKRSINKERKRYRKLKHRSKLIKSEKLWTKNSALFFAATTMATIGYGNIVPVTTYGRIACVIFALFGVPLTIITIGDLGKFLSECIIWLFGKMKKFRLHFSNFKWQRVISNHNPELGLPEKSDKTMKQLIDWNNLVLDKAEVPLILVFAILLFYIAFGAFLFASFESWTYADAFYFCFVSLTTIGFGDLAPENEQYVLLMLIYLGFGLAVASMSIDLVGIQYIQKIHYFGRKFRAADLLQLLRRKQIIEYGLTNDDSDQFLQLCLNELQEVEITTSNMSTSANYGINNYNYTNNNDDLQRTKERKVSHNETTLLLPHATAIMQSSSKSLIFRDEIEIEQSFNKSNSKNEIEDQSILPITRIESNRSILPVTSAESDQSILPVALLKQPDRDENHCKRSFPNDRFSIKALSERLSNPKVIGVNQSFLSTLSQQQLSDSQLSSSVFVPLVSSSSSPAKLASTLEYDSNTKLLDETNKSLIKLENRAKEVFVSEATMITYGDEDYLIENDEVVSKKGVYVSELPQRLSPSSSASSPSSLPSTTSSINRSKQVLQNIKHDSSAFKSGEEIGTKSEVLPEQTIMYYHDVPVHSLHQKTVETKNALQNLINARESLVSRKLPPVVVDDNYCFVIDGNAIQSEPILCDHIHWTYTSRLTQYFYSVDLRKFNRVRCVKARGKIIAVRTIGSQAQRLNALRSSRSNLIHQSRSLDSTSLRSITTIGDFHSNTVPLMQVYAVTRIYSFWKTCPSFRRIITLLDRVTEDEVENMHFQKRIFMQHIWRNTKQSDKERVKTQARCVTHCDSTSSGSTDSVIAFPVELHRTANSSEQGTDSNSDSESDTILGDSTIFSIENTALDTRMTLCSLLNCPFEYINKQPPLLAMENYCFVIDGGLIDVQHIIENSKSWWKQTSSRVRYYLPKGVKTFYEVDALLCRGELRCAYTRMGRTGIIQPVPLDKIFRVTRIFSYWKTCINFHRIISCINPVTQNGIEVYGFQKRIFVQYLWRTEKQEEKRRVAQEYRASKIPIPSRQKNFPSTASLSIQPQYLIGNSIGVTAALNDRRRSRIPHPKVNYSRKKV